MEERRGRGAQCCSWHGYGLEILGDTPDQLAILAGALQKWRRDKEYKPSEIFDLSHYSERVEGCGLEKPYYLPSITRKRYGDGWFPDNVIFAARYKPEGAEGPVATALSVREIQCLEQALRTAKDENRTEFVLRGFPEPITVDEAEAMVTAFREAERDVATRSFNINKAGARIPVRMNGLIVRPNVDEVDYAEPYGDLALPAGSKALLPTSLKRDVRLLEHHKTPNAMVSRAAKKQNARFRIACTGTPVENTLTDLWCLFDFIQPGLLGSLRCFAERYRKPIEAETDEEKTRVEELRRLIAGQTLRRNKAEVAKDLPLKIVDRGCRSLLISEEQRIYYEDALSKFKRGYGVGSSAGLYDLFGLLLHLRKVCSDPKPPGYDPSKLQSLTELERCSPKMRWMLTELLAIEARGEKAIVFCEFRELQRTIQHAIVERLSLFVEIINGDTPAAGERSDNRQKRIEAFQKRPGFGVIILSPLAVGFGMNIQMANHVIHFTRAWNPAREDQATDRAYRIGQNKNVFVYYPLVVAEDFVTFDAKLDRLLEIKRRLSQDMLNGCSDLRPSDFSDLKNCEGSTLLDLLPESPSATDSFDLQN
jgi:SNF2-related domain/Helicase conserved C-terminal domain